MQQFKKIAVCHGKSCSSKGASHIKQLLEQEYAQQGIEVAARECCGRCEHSCTIVVDNQAISDLSPAALREKFICNPAKALSDACVQDAKASEELERLLSDEL